MYKLSHNYILLLLGVILSLSSCATRKNTWITRNYHALITHYNIYFNGNESYKEGLKKLNKEPKDDYSKIIPLYTIGIPNYAQTVSSEMDNAILKCRKAIKLHSIQKKPKIDRKKLKDPKYQHFLKKEEYNNQLKYAWLLQGKSELHKGDFMGAVSTFSYITRHYATEFEIVLEAKLWQARAYTEMGWLYEAEELLSRINPNEVSYKLKALYEGTNANLLIKLERYSEAVHFLKNAIIHERNKNQYKRNCFVLAQLLQQLGDKKEALTYYQQVTKNNVSPYVMTFNAQIKIAELTMDGDIKKIIKSLNKMAKETRNKDYLDQIYFAEGNIYLQNENEQKAIESYKKAIEKSTRNGIEKALVQIKLADLYYNNNKYLEAQPHYSDAAKLLGVENEEYRRISNLSDVLSELAFDYQTIVLQDSLLNIAKLPEAEQMVIIEKVIENVIKEEQELQKRQEEEEYAAQRAAANISSIPNFQSSSTDWYFYNSNLINKGRAEFSRKWGNRKLEDNWRRQNKMIVNSETDNLYAEELNSDSVNLAIQNITDNKKPEFYLNQIPNTPVKENYANNLISNALFNMGYIYYLKLEDNKMAVETFDKLQSRYPDYEKLADSYYYCYQIAQKQEDSLKVEYYRNLILSKYPESTFAVTLSKPDYATTMSDMYFKQDSLYEATYEAYAKGDFITVKDNYDYMKDNYQMSSLMPKFSFLNALSIGKTKAPEVFKEQLKSLVNTYPQSDVTAMAKDIIAMIEQGFKAQKSSSHGTLLTLREEVINKNQQDENVGKSFLTEIQTSFMIVFDLHQDIAYANAFMYDIAAFNFSKFLIKDFDLKLIRRSDNHYWLTISGLENRNDALWYFKTIDAEASLHQYILNSSYVFISEDNYKILGEPPFAIENYLDFYQKQILILNQ